PGSRTTSELQPFPTRRSSDLSVTAGRLYDPLKDKSSLLALLVESEGEPPILYADLDGDGLLADSEKFEMTRDEDDNPYIRQVTLDRKSTRLNSSHLGISYAVF